MKMVPLGEVLKPAKVQRAGSLSLPILSMTMHHGLVDQSTKFKKKVASTDVSSYKVIDRGQLVVSFPIDEGVLDFQSRYDRAIVSPAYNVWELIDEYSVDRNYLQKFLTSPRAIQFYKSKLQGSTARRRSLPKSVFLEHPVPLPPLVEQRRIAAILDKADAIRQKRHQAIAHLDTLTQSIFHEMFRGSADWVTIEELAATTQYGSSSKAGKAGGWPMLRMGNISYKGQLLLDDLKYLDLTEKEVPKYTVREGDLLFNRTNSAELVGKTCVVDTDTPLAFAGYLIRVRFPQPETSVFVSGYLNSPHGKQTLRGMAKAIVGQANINATELKSIRVPRVSVGEHRHYATRVAESRRRISSFRQCLTSSESLFASLQSRAFRGEL